MDKAATIIVVMMNQCGTKEVRDSESGSPAGRSLICRKAWCFSARTPMTQLAASNEEKTVTAGRNQFLRHLPAEHGDVA
jgi:hypothetical protein